MSDNGPDYTTRETCRVCNSKDLIHLFSLGEQYVSDFPTKENLDRGIKCPIELIKCNHCTLVQLKHTARQDFLYTLHYWYRSSVTQTMRDALKDVARSAVKCVDLYPGDTVLDIGSNDGFLLRSYDTRILHTVGVEPASNLAEEGSKGIVTFINDFWSYEAYQKHNCQPAKIITALGMFYDLESPNEFIADVAQALHRDGVFIAQLMCLSNMIRMNDIGNLAHEHLEFYTLQSLEYLYDRHGLEIYDIETNSVNGQSFRIYARHRGSNIKARNPLMAAARIRQIRMDESRFNNSQFFSTFFAQLEEAKNTVVAFIKQAVSEGKKVWVYGSSTKGNVILQWLGLDSTLIVGAADKSPEKWDRYTIGSNIPIHPEDEMRRANPDFCLILPYAFRQEFIKREEVEEWRKTGGRFIIPLPQMEIV